MNNITIAAGTKGQLKSTRTLSKTIAIKRANYAY